MPSPHGIRVAPKIPDELRKKVAQAVAAKDRKDGKVSNQFVKFYQRSFCESHLFSRNNSSLVILINKLRGQIC